MVASKKKSTAKTKKPAAGSAKPKSTKKPVKKPVKQTADPGKCSGWKAWLNMMPPGPATLHVIGQCTFPTHGYKVRLQKAVPQGINPAILLLKKVVTPPSGPVIQTPQVVQIHYTLKKSPKYTNVTILPDGKTIKVEIVV